MSEISKLEQKLIIKKIDNKTVNLSINDNDMLMTIVGQFDQNLKDLSKLTNTDVYFRGNSITCKGEKEKIASFCEAVKFLINKYFLTNIIEKEDIISSVKKNLELKESNVKSFKQLIKTPKKSVIARSEKQSEYIKALKENDIVMSVGPAGTGKSFLAVSVAITLLMEKKIDRVILSRPAVEAGEKLGFLPGDMKEKVDPYMQPLYDALNDFLPGKVVSKMYEKGSIEIAPLAFMRGRTLKDSFIILDEGQNASPSQMKMFLTRLGIGSRMVVTGDITQIDLPRGFKSGLVEASEVLSKISEIDFIKFNDVDIVRHSLVRKIAKAYEKNSKQIHNSEK